jgi:hypothetical protein
MALVIDPLSVATQGHFESPNDAAVEPRRDALRIATLGWIIFDFIAAPDPNQDTGATIRCPASNALIVEFESSFSASLKCSTGLIVSFETSAELVRSKTNFVVE